MPFTANRQFKAKPRMLAKASGMYYETPDGRKILDGVAGLWCVNAGHGRKEITQAVAQQLETMDYAPAFQIGHPAAFELANGLVGITPAGLQHVFFTNSGSESVDTALKIALAYHRVKGDAARTRLLGRERGYHGVGFGGISVGGMVANRKVWPAAMIPGVDHLPHTHDLKRNAFTKGQPAHGAELAEDLERLVALHDASTIAAVIVEPIAGSTGVVLPPKGYLERLRAICDKHGILLIFDEVITGFGRTGAPFAAQEFGVTPDIMTCAKGLTNGAIPMGAVIVSKKIYETFMQGPPGAIELFHGYTYSAHPAACAAGLATLSIIEDERLMENAVVIGDFIRDELKRRLADAQGIREIRGKGLMVGIELELPCNELVQQALDRGLLINVTMDNVIRLLPPLVMKREEAQEVLATLVPLISAFLERPRAPQAAAQTA
jgi:beta-alanine--pyruvate transaminase